MSRYVSDQQEEIIQDEKHYVKLVSGVPGAGKTNLIVYHTIENLSYPECHTQIVTMMTSVTTEIKQRLVKYQGLQLKKLGKTNHYGKVEKKSAITLSTLGAWIHQLCEYNKIQVPGHDFEKKKILLFRWMETNEDKFQLTMRTSNKPKPKTPKCLIVDETQDCDLLEIKILIKVITLFPTLVVIMAYDVLQSLKEIEFARHLNFLSSLPSAKIFPMSICYRCPYAHIAFNNFLLQDVRRLRGLDDLTANNANLEDRPFLFYHEGLRNKEHNDANAEIVLQIITTLFKLDTSLLPGNVVINMRATNDNDTFVSLLERLNGFFASTGFGSGKFVHFRTNDGEKINWEENEHNAVAASIMAVKGRDRSVIINLGLTEKAIPACNEIDNERSLNAESYINVMTSRSTKYLFIGFTKSSPSRYLAKKREELSNYCYEAYNKDFLLFPEPYRSIAYRLRQDASDITWPHHLSSGYERKLKNYTIKHHFIETLRYPSILFQSDDAINAENEEFGEEVDFSLLPQNKDNYDILRSIVQLVMLRKNFPQLLSGFLPKYQLIRYVRDKQVFLKYHDMKEECRRQTDMPESEESDLTPELHELISSKAKVALDCFNTECMRRCFDIYFDENVHCLEIPSDVWWKLAIFNAHISDKKFLQHSVYVLEKTCPLDLAGFVRNVFIYANSVDYENKNLFKKFRLPTFVEKIPIEVRETVECFSTATCELSLSVVKLGCVHCSESQKVEPNDALHLNENILYAFLLTMFLRDHFKRNVTKISLYDLGRGKRIVFGPSVIGKLPLFKVALQRVFQKFYDTKTVPIPTDF